MTYGKQCLLLAGVALAGYGAVVLIAYLNQRSLLYFPTHVDPQTRLSPWRVGGEMIGYARETPNPSRVWLMMHGNGGQAAHRDYILRFVGSSDAVFVLEYPGYGLRPGRPTRDSMDRAASEAYRELRRRFPGCPLGVIGESLGSGPACSLAREPVPPDRIVLITPFDTLLRVATKRMWYLPVWLILKDRWDNIAALRDYTRPVDVYGARDDRIIPVAHAEALAKAIGARFTLMPAGHNDWMKTYALTLK